MKREYEKPEVEMVSLIAAEEITSENMDVLPPFFFEIKPGPFPHSMLKLYRKGVHYVKEKYIKSGK